jgi:hypothetical protein
MKKEEISNIVTFRSMKIAPRVDTKGRPVQPVDQQENYIIISLYRREYNTAAYYYEAHFLL